MNLRRRLQAVLRNNQSHGGRRFIPALALSELITCKTVLLILERCDIPVKHELVGRIVSTASKVFAILVLMEREHHILTFLDGGLCDDKLPLEEISVPSFESDGDKRNFFATQWSFPPTFDKQSHLEVSKDMVLPFLHMPHIDNGSFGMIYKSRLQRAIFPGQQIVVALKRIVKSESEPWDNIMREVETLRRREHPNIVPLLASFTLYDVESGYEQKSLNLVFPYADMNMETWMNLEQTPPQLLAMDMEAQRKYLYQSMYQLASALSFLHRELDGMVTSHHDLKPRNILVLGNMLMICDMGRSQLIPLVQGSETDGPKGTFAYHPPEYWNDDGTRASRRHGRAFDVWSMGCILTEIATLVVYGWETQKVCEYRVQRLNAPGRRQFKMRGQLDDSFHNHMDEVNKWIAQLKKTDGSYVLEKCLGIAVAMLKIVPTERLYSWEAELDLFELLHPDNPRMVRLEKGALCVQPPRLGASLGAHTPLSRAILQGNHDRVTQLQKVGWSVDYGGGAGVFPIQIPLRSGDPVASSSVLLQGTNNGDPSSPKQSGADELANFTRAIRGKAADEAFAIITQSSSLGELLHQKDEDGLTALHWASRFGTFSIVKFILDQLKGLAALEIKDDFGMTPLHHSSERASEDVVLLMLNSYPDKEKLVFNKDSNGKLPLHWAAQGGNVSVAKLLLSSTSNPSVMLAGEDDSGNSPLQLAQKYNRTEIEVLLRTYKQVSC